MIIKFTHYTPRRAAGTIDYQYFEVLWDRMEGWVFPWYLNDAKKAALHERMFNRTVQQGGGDEE